MKCDYEKQTNKRSPVYICKINRMPQLEKLIAVNAW